MEVLVLRHFQLPAGTKVYICENRMSITSHPVTSQSVLDPQDQGLQSRVQVKKPTRTRGLAALLFLYYLTSFLCLS